MNRFLNIIKIIMAFVLSVLFLCCITSLVLIWTNHIEWTDFRSNIIEHFLYVVGYGESQSINIVRIIFAIIGLITVSTLSAVLTIQLFWKIDDVVINNKCFITFNDTYDKPLLYLFIVNKGADICNIKIKLSSYYVSDTSHSEICYEEERPLLLKKSIWKIQIPIKDKSLYKALRLMYKSVLNNSQPKISFFLTISYVDTNNGQETIQVRQYTYDDISMPSNDIILEDKSFKSKLRKLRTISKERYTNKKFREWIIDNYTHYSLENITPLENCGTLSKGLLDIPTNVKMDKYHIQFKESIRTTNTEEFMMLFWNLNNASENWTTHYNENGYVSFYLAATSSIENVKFQLKSTTNGIRSIIFEQDISPSTEVQEYKYYLKDIFPAKLLENNSVPEICEICFCVYGKDMNGLDGDIYVSNVEVASIS